MGGMVAKAGTAVTAILAAIRAATDRTKSMRLIVSATSLLVR